MSINAVYGTPPHQVYYTTQRQSSPTTKANVVGLALLGGLLGMPAYYLPVRKNTFVNRAFNIKRDNNYDKIECLKEAAKEVEKKKLSTESKLLLKDLGVGQSIPAITRKCQELEKEVTNKASVKALKDNFADVFENCGKDTHKMDSACADAYKAVRFSHFRWGIGIGAGIGLAIGLLSLKDR